MHYFQIKKKSFRYCFLQLLLCCTQFAYPQYKESDFTHYKSADGLADNNVYSLAQDDRGFIWIGTESGLNQFDGKNFITYLGSEKPFHLPGSNIYRIISLSGHRLGIITPKGFHVINTIDFSTEDYLLPDTSFFSNYLNAVEYAVELPDKKIALSSKTGLYVFDRPSHLFFRYDEFKAGDVKTKRIAYGRAILPLNSDELLLWTQGAALEYFQLKNGSHFHVGLSDKKWSVFYMLNHDLYDCGRIGPDQYMLCHYKSDSVLFYDISTNSRVYSKVPFRAKEEFNYTSKIFKLNDSSFAINCSRNGFYIFHVNYKTGAIIFNPEKLLPRFKCNQLLIDKENRLWVGTRTGLLKQKTDAPFLKAVLINSEPAKEDVQAQFSGICRVGGKLYIGAYNRYQGLFVVDTATMKLIKNILFFGGNNEWNEILSVQNYYTDTLWIGTNEGLLWLDTKTYRYGEVIDNRGEPIFPKDPVKLFPVDKNGYAWLCNLDSRTVARYNINQRSLTYFTTKDYPSLLFAQVKHITYDAYGDVWISGHALARWNHLTGLFDTLITVYDGAYKYADDINTITADNKGSLWVHNSENSLLEYKIREKKFYYYNGIDAGMSSIKLQSLAQEVNDKLWFTTGARLGCFDISHKTSILFDNSDSLPDDRSSSRTIFFDKGRNCFYSLHNNYLVIFPALLPPKEKFSDSDFIITRLVLKNSVLYYPADRINLDYNQQNISVHFTLIDYEAPGAVNFAYRIDKGDWINLENQRQINFNHLGQGKIHLQIRATGKYGHELIREIQFIISPPFWLRWWFIILVLLLAGGTVYLIYRYRTAQLKKFFVMRTKISQDLHDEVGATLSGISMYSHLTKEQIKREQTEDVEKSLNVIQQSASDMVTRLNDIVWVVNPQHDSLQKLIQKLEEFATEIAMAKNIKVQVVVPSPIANLKLKMENRRNIYLLCKEAINNAVKYSHASLLELTVQEVDHSVQFLVRDNGIGFDVQTIKKGNGLENMQKRADEIGAKLVLHSDKNKGTEISLQCKIT